MAQQKQESTQSPRTAPANAPAAGQGKEPRGEIQHTHERWLERGSHGLGSPLAFTRRFLDDVDQLFGEFFGSGPLATPYSSALGGRDTFWSPQIEIFQRDSDLVVRAELPGVKKDDVQVEMNEDTLTIEGRREQHAEERRGAVYHTERSYGSFRRTIPLPEGVIAESANATFKDGVLEIVMQAPPSQGQARGRRLEIKSGEGDQSQPEKH